jgi:predicted RNA-binding protein with RPS1 domain
MSDPSSSIEPAVRWIATDRDVQALARLVADPERPIPLVGITVQPELERPMLDVDALATELGERAEVWVIPNKQHQWQLTEELPEGLDVYGGAVRVWWPIPDPAALQPTEHPTFNVFSEEDAARAVRDVVDYLTTERQPEPARGDDLMATITAVQPNGAELTLETGHLGFVANSHLADNAEIFHAGEVVQEGQKVKVRVSDDPDDSGRDRLRVSMRPHAPSPWKRLAEVYKDGAVVEGVVLRVAPFGAFVALLPGAEGLIHVSRISRDFVDDPYDYVQDGERVIVRILQIDEREGRAELSLIDVPQGAKPEPIPSLYEDGPPFLPPLGQGPAGGGPGGPEQSGLEADLADVSAYIAETEAHLADAKRHRDGLLNQLGRS